MATARRDAARPGAERSPAQLFALVFGIVYLLVGLVGFAITGFDHFADAEQAANEELILFALNPLHNIVHLAVGALLLSGSRTHASAKSANLIVGVVYGLVFLLGILDVEFVVNTFAIDNEDDFLHIATSILAILFGTVLADGPRRDSAATA